jgi:hypothetical protein
VLDGPSNPDASRDVVWPNCIDDSCPYMLDGGIPAVVIEAHNTLARRAEIGALVEEIADETGGVMICSAADEPGYLVWTAGNHTPRHQGAMLDALRSLAAEIGGGDAS